MFQRKLLFCAFLCTFSSIFAQDDIDSNLTQKYIDSAKNNLDRGELNSTIKWAEKAILQERENYLLIDQANMLIADAYFEQRKLDSCQIYLNKVFNNYKKSGIKTTHLASAYFTLGDINNFNGEYAKGIPNYKESISIWKKNLGNNHRFTINARIHLTIVLRKSGQYKEAKVQIKKAIESCLANDDLNEGLLASAYINLATLHSIEGDQRTAIGYLEKAIKINLEVHGPSHHIVGSTYANLGISYLLLKDYDKAIIYFKRSEKIFLASHRPNKYHVLSSTYSNIGSMYRSKREYEKAIIYLNKSIDCAKEVLDENHPHFASAYVNLGAIYDNMDKNDEALKFYLKSVDIYLNSGAPYHSDLASTYNDIGYLYIKSKDYLKAKFYVDKTLDIYYNIFEPNNVYFSYPYNYLGRIYRGLGNNEKAIYFHKKALSLVQNVPSEPNDNRYYKIWSYTELAKDYKETDELELMNQNLNLIPELLKYNVNTPFNFKNTEDYYYNDLKDYFLLKSDYYNSKLEKTKNQKYSDSIKINNNTLLKLHAYWSQELLNPNDRSFRIKAYLNIYEKSISHLISRNQKDELEQAFIIGEKTKSRILSENFRESKAQHFGKVPDSLINKENDLKIDIAYFDKKFYETQNDSLKKIYENKLFNLKLNQDELYKTFKTKFPKYHQLKYQHEVVNVQDIQQILTPKQTLLEYFVGDENIFIYTISKNDFNVKKVLKDFPLEQWVTDLRNSIYEYEKEPIAYIDVAHKLYLKLILPVQKKLKKKLVIVPDGVLNYMPFEVLLTTNASGITNYENLPYFIRKYQTSYNYSATLFKYLAEKRSTNTKGNFLAFAPNFDAPKKEYASREARRNGLTQLKYNIPEVKSLNGLIDGTLFTGNQATEDNFLMHAKDYKIIHLSTHGKSNDKLGDYSFIAFSNVNDSIADKSRLYVRELYNLELNADMAVLSACETGLGELKRGEGIIGLARGFTYAGAKSTINSLWNVDDAKTKKIMELFYSNIIDGMAKDEALHNAKIAYLDEDNYSAPYYWASFIAVGNMDPIELNNTTNYWWFIAISLLLITIIAVYRKKKTP